MKRRDVKIGENILICALGFIFFFVVCFVVKIRFLESKIDQNKAQIQELKEESEGCWVEVDTFKDITWGHLSGSDCEWWNEICP
jgi:hypothetical protein